MNDWKKNTLANMVGQGWAALVGFLVVPVYIRLLGMEGYGLIGVYMVMQEVFNSLLDFGLTTTVNREVARYSASPEKASQTRDLIQTLERGYWLIGLLLALMLALASSFIANVWLKTEVLPASYVRRVILWMAVATFFQWPLTFYQAGLLGLQRMVALNKLNIAFATLRNAGAALVLWAFAPTVLAFFQWQTFAIAVQVAVMRAALWRSLPPSDHAPRFDANLLRSLWRFAAGMSATSIIAFVISQADRVTLSKILPLEFFGYYTLATTLNSGVVMITSQVNRALFPRFAALIAARDEPGLIRLYHKGAQSISVLSFSLAAVAALFAQDLVLLWTQNPLAAAQTAPIFALLTIGSAINAVIALLYSLTVASGWSSFGFYVNLTAIPFFIPAMIGFSLWRGGAGAALALLTLNAAYLTFVPAFAHKRVLPGELRSWYIHDVALPAVSIALTAVVSRALLLKSFPALSPLPLAAICGLLVFAAAALSAAELRAWLFSLWRKWLPGAQRRFL